MEDGHEDNHMKAYIRDGRYQIFMDAKGYASLPKNPLDAELQDASDGHTLNKKITLKFNKEAIASEAETVPPNAYFDEIKEIQVVITEGDYHTLWLSGSLSIRSGQGFDISIEDDLSGMV